MSAVVSGESAPTADRSVGCLAVFLWSCFGAPGAAWLVAEGLYRTFGITRGTLALATLPVVGVISWLVFRSCRFGPVRALLYTLVSLAVVGGLFVLLAYWIGPNL